MRLTEHKYVITPLVSTQLSLIPRALKMKKTANCRHFIWSSMTTYVTRGLGNNYTLDTMCKILLSTNMRPRIVTRIVKRF